MSVVGGGRGFKCFEQARTTRCGRSVALVSGLKEGKQGKKAGEAASGLMPARARLPISGVPYVWSRSGTKKTQPASENKTQRERKRIDGLDPQKNSAQRENRRRADSLFVVEVFEQVKQRLLLALERHLRVGQGMRVCSLPRVALHNQDSSFIHSPPLPSLPPSSPYFLPPF